MGPLLKAAGDLVATDTDKAEVLDAFFALTFTNKSPFVPQGEENLAVVEKYCQGSSLEESQPMPVWRTSWHAGS